MNLSEKSIERLIAIIIGHKKLSHSRSISQLQLFFQEAIGDDQDIPGIWYFANEYRAWELAGESIRISNNTPILKKIIISAVHPSNFLYSMYDDEVQFSIKNVICYLNECFEYDGYEIVPHGKGYDVIDKTQGEVLCDITLQQNNLSSDFIKEQINKCKTKIFKDDYDGAITNARSLIESVLRTIEGEFNTNSPKGTSLPKLYKNIQKHLKLSPEDQINDSFKQTLSGFVSIINSLSSLSNKMGDRHAREYKPSKHHAVLVVNSAMTFSTFIFNTFEYQQK